MLTKTLVMCVLFACRRHGRGVTPVVLTDHPGRTPAHNHHASQAGASWFVENAIRCRRDVLVQGWQRRGAVNRHARRRNREPACPLCRQPSVIRRRPSTSLSPTCCWAATGDPHGGPCRDRVHQEQERQHTGFPPVRVHELRRERDSCNDTASRLNTRPSNRLTAHWSLARRRGRKPVPARWRSNQVAHCGKLNEDRRPPGKCHLAAHGRRPVRVPVGFRYWPRPFGIGEQGQAAGERSTGAGLAAVICRADRRAGRVAAKTVSEARNPRWLQAKHKLPAITIRRTTEWANSLAVAHVYRRQAGSGRLTALLIAATAAAMLASGAASAATTLIDSNSTVDIDRAPVGCTAG